MSIMSTAFAACIRFAPDRHRRAIAECLMKATIVVEGDPVCDSCLGLAAVGIALEIDVLMLERPPQPLDEDVVHPTTAAIHGDLDPCARQRAGEGRTGELAALVGVVATMLRIALRSPACHTVPERRRAQRGRTSYPLYWRYATPEPHG